MKIALVAQPLDLVIHPSRNSLGIWIYEVANRLAQFCDVIVYTKKGRLQQKVLEEKVVRDERVDYQLVPIAFDRVLLKLLPPWVGSGNPKHPLFASKLYYLGYALQVAIDLRKQQCDVVHLFNFSQFVPIIRAFNPHLKIILRMSCEWLTQLDHSMIQQRLREVDLLIGCSDYITEKTRNSFPEFANRCQTLLNGRDVNYFVPSKSQSKTATKEIKKLLFIGRISPEKGVHVLLDAFAKVVESYPQVQLEIVGSRGVVPKEFMVELSDNPLVQSLASFYTEDYWSHLQNKLTGELAKKVFFSGYTPHFELVNRYQNSDIFIFPSVWDEPSGNPPIEAMAVGVPVISTPTGGTAEYVADGKTGLLVEPGNATALAAAILRLLEHEDLRKAMGEAGRQRVVALFSWERVVEDLLCKYEQLGIGD
ncbi:MAG: glycosyltransferase family 4 protein [Symploca sp. SIO2E6]|nr:glycosyltransferase family 4 protein [Symploca sp. SIO2E6]